MSQAKKDATGPGFHKPCREYEKCNHKKHGYTRKRRHEIWRAKGWVSPAAAGQK
jgi:hypothetical protein